MKRGHFLLFLLMTFVALPCYAIEQGLSAITVINSAGEQTTYSLTLKILFGMTVLTVLPALLMTMTAFTRIIIVLSILRQAIGMATTPTNQILIGIALFLTLFIMTPVIDTVNAIAIQPHIKGEMTLEDALFKAEKPVKEFMFNQTRENDLTLFAQLAKKTNFNSVDDVPLTVLMPAFLTSELKTAFQMGFVLFLPFLIIDLVVASVLMAMGMMMLSPLIISLPFKIMLFVLVDGWVLVLGTLSASFGV